MQLEIYYGYGLDNKSIHIWDKQIERLTRLMLQWDWGEVIGVWDKVFVFYDHKGYHLVAVAYNLDTLDDDKKIDISSHHGYYECSDCNEFRNRVGRYLRLLLTPYEKVLNILLDHYLEEEVRGYLEEENDE